MSPATTSTTVTSATALHHIWRSPLPYLFGGLALMLLLISVALVILVCSYRKHSTSITEDEEKPKQPVDLVFDAERKIALVILAGDDKPTHVATEMIITTPGCYCTCSSDQKA